MHKFPYLEHYIEFMSGIRNAKGQLTSMFDRTSPLRLANYDIQVLDDIGSQLTGQRLPLTDKQRDLCLHLANKYARQLRKLGVEPPEPNIACELPVREVNRERSLSIRDNSLALKFPFNSKIIPLVREQASISQGHMAWHKDLGYWKLAGTEPNIVWAVDFCRENNVEIDKEVIELYDKIKTQGKSKWGITLFRGQRDYEIENASQSLIDYVNEQRGGLSRKNFNQLVDSASQLGYSLSSKIKVELLERNYSADFVTCLDNYKTVVSEDTFVLRVYPDLIKWMIECGKGPIIIYDPLAQFAKYIISPDDRITQGLLTRDMVVLAPADSYNLISELRSTPWTLISFFSMMSYNSKHTEMIQNAERLIYVGSQFKNMT